MKQVIISILLIGIILGFESCQKANDLTPNITFWNRNQTAIEVKSGVELTISFDEVNKEWKYKVENKNAFISTRVRIEVHTFDAAGKQMFEFGPTTPIDMNSGQVINATIAAPNAGNFATFSTHAESGAAEGGG